MSPDQTDVERTMEIPRSARLRKQRLDDAQTRVKVLRECLHEAEGQLHDFQQALVAEALGRSQDDAIEVGSWECERSPLGVCAYDPDDDPCLDDCLFCHDPHERK